MSEQRFAAMEGGVTLEVTAVPGRDGPVVIAASHSGADDEPQRLVLETLCRVIENCPLKEASDHGAIRALHELRAWDGAMRVPGIFLPKNAGQAFLLAETLIRRISNEAMSTLGIEDTPNFWNPPVGNSWLDLTEREQIDRLNGIIGEFLHARGRMRGSLRVEGIDREVRVVLGGFDTVENSEKPQLMRELERAMRNATGIRLELYMSDMRDANDIRRIQDLGLQAQISEGVQQ